MGPYAFCLPLFFVFVGINCQYMELTTPSYFTTDEPADFKLNPEICRICVCVYGDGKVFCNDQNLDTYFSSQEWEDIAYFRPKIVDLSSNVLTRVTSMANLPIEKLDLSHNRIEDIEHGSFRDLQGMRVLDLSYNKLTSKLSPHAFEGRYTPEEYEPLSSMRVLNLAYNDFCSLNPDLFEHVPELTSLDLTGNPLTTIDHVTMIAISSLPMLKDLRLRSCQLSEIPEKFLHTPRYLEHLDLSDNQLIMVPQELKETKNLVFLNLNQNPIVELDMGKADAPGFPTLRKMQELHMCNMPELRRIGSGALAGLENLSKLNMSFNPKLADINLKALARPDDFGETYDWPIVKELYLQHNKLSGIDIHLLKRWDLLEKVDLSNNPFRCVCSNQWMVDILVPIIERIKPNESEKLVCVSPYGMQRYTMKYIHDTHQSMICRGADGKLTTGTPAYQLEDLTDDEGSMLKEDMKDTELATPFDHDEEFNYILTGLIGGLVIIAVVLFLAVFWKLGYFGWLRGHIQKGSRPAASPAKV